MERECGVCGWMDGWMDRRTNGCTDSMNEWMKQEEGRKEGSCFVCVPYRTLHRTDSDSCRFGDSQIRLSHRRCFARPRCPHRRGASCPLFFPVQISRASWHAAALGPRPLSIKNTTRMNNICLLYTSPSPRDLSTSRMPSSA